MAFSTSAWTHCNFPIRVVAQVNRQKKTRHKAGFVEKKYELSGLPFQTGDDIGLLGRIVEISLYLRLPRVDSGA